MRHRRNFGWEFEVTRERISLWRRLSPSQLFVGSFVLLIAVGTVGLKTIPGLYVDQPLSWIDALFTATSASCVTGLTVADTAKDFTPAGQAWLLALIQCGGLGIITFTTLLTFALGRRLSLRHEALTASATEVAPHVDYRRLARDILWFTFAIELTGAALLLVDWGPRLGWRASLWPSFFHSISAFCNAGFSTFPLSMGGEESSAMSLTVIMGLIIAGGLGFLTMEELTMWGRARRRRRPFRISLHSRLVLITTAILVVGGGLVALYLEWGVTLKDMPPGSKFVNAMFISVTARTAGFTNIDYARATDATNFLTVILMSIGGSPGSTAGGLKTTTTALLVLMAWSRVGGTKLVSIWGRSIPRETMQRAMGLAVATLAIVILSVFALVAIEGSGVPHEESGGGFMKYLFEATSALNTVGLTMGVTPGLSNSGKLIAILLMFIGRVGLPTTAGAFLLAERTPAGDFRYAYEDVAVG